MNNNKYKIIAFDLDGTLLTWNKKIKVKNLEKIKQFTDNGGQVIIATGKSFFNSLKYIQKVEKFCNTKIRYAVCSNGSFVYDFKKKKCIYEKVINDNAAKEILSISFRYNLISCLYAKKSNSNNTMLVDGIKKDIYIRFINYINKHCFLKHIKEKDKYEAFKINILTLNLLAKKRLNNAFDQFKNVKNTNIFRTKKYFFEIVAQDVCKGNALKFLSKLLNIPLNNFAAFGDSHNDISMFSVVGLPISVRKLEEDFNSKCKVIVNKKIKNKIAWAIDNYIL